MAYIDQVKQWFVSKAKPQQNQYHTLFDYLRFRDQPIPVGDVANLTVLLQGKLDVSVFENTVMSSVVQEIPWNADGAISLQAGYLLEKILLIPATSSPVKIGNSAGADDLLPETIVSQSTGEVVHLDAYAPVADRLIYISGLPPGSSIIVIKRKVKTI